MVSRYIFIDSTVYPLRKKANCKTGRLFLNLMKCLVLTSNIKSHPIIISMCCPFMTQLILDVTQFLLSTFFSIFVFFGMFICLFRSIKHVVEKKVEKFYFIGVNLFSKKHLIWCHFGMMKRCKIKRSSLRLEAVTMTWTQSNNRCFVLCFIIFILLVSLNT